MGAGQQAVGEQWARGGCRFSAAEVGGIMPGVCPVQPLRQPPCPRHLPSAAATAAAAAAAPPAKASSTPRKPAAPPRAHLQHGAEGKGEQHGAAQRVREVLHVLPAVAPRPRRATEAPQVEINRVKGAPHAHQACRAAGKPVWGWGWSRRSCGWGGGAGGALHAAAAAQQQALLECHAAGPTPRPPKARNQPSFTHPARQRR